MARIKDQFTETNKMVEITQAEVDRYSEFCKEHKQYMVGGVWVTSREQYLINQGWMTLKDGEFFVQDTKGVKHVDELDKRRRKEIFTPSKEFWDELKQKNNLMKEKVVHAGDDEIPF